MTPKDILEVRLWVNREFDKGRLDSGHYVELIHLLMLAEEKARYELKPALIASKSV